MKTTRALLLGTIATLAGCSQADNRYQLSEQIGGNFQIWFDTQTGETLICLPGDDRLASCDHRPAFAEHVAKAAAARSKSEAIERSFMRERGR